MRTTLTLDDDVAARLQAEARKTGRPFKTVVNEYLRAGLAQRRAAKAGAPFRVEPVSMGVPPPGRSYDNVGALLEEIEGPEQR
ncbi:MAG: ribbon-helix-helix protein, CopG family [Steroidobacteraceae bacterium]